MFRTGRTFDERAIELEMYERMVLFYLALSVPAFLGQRHHISLKCPYPQGLLEIRPCVVE